MTRALVAVLFVGLLTAACRPGAGGCSTIPVAADLRPALTGARDALGGEPVMPCAYTRGFRIERMQVQPLLGVPSVTMAVMRDGEPRFLFTQAESMADFTAIPAGSTSVRRTIASVAVRGFEGPSGSGSGLLLLRWETGGRAYEYQATLTPQFGRAEAYRTVAGLVARARTPGAAADE